MRVFGIDLKDVEKTLSNLGDLKKLRDSVADLKISEESLFDLKYTDAYDYSNSLGYNLAIDDVLQIIDSFLSGGDAGV